MHLSHNGPFKPGSVISGRVILLSRSAKGESVDTQSIVVVFTGRCTTKNGSLDAKSPNHGNIILYSHERKVFTGPKTLHAPSSSAAQRDRDPHSWPFEFMVPLDCALAQSSRFVKDSNFDDDKDQRLPPSFKDHDPDPDAVYYGNILHELIATFTSSKNKLFSSSPKVLEKRYSLDLVQVPAAKIPSEPVTSSANDVSWYRSDGDFFPIQTHSTGFRAAVGLSKPQSKPSPDADFTVRFQFPSTAQIGQPLLVSVAVLQEANSKSYPSPSSLPEILLRRATFHLQTFTLVRGTYGKALEDLRRDTHSWDKSQIVLNCVFGQPIKLTTPTPKSSSTRDAAVAASITDLRHFADLTFEPKEGEAAVMPSVKTFNVSRVYYLSATFMIVVDGKTSQPVTSGRSRLAVIGREADDIRGSATRDTGNAHPLGTVVDVEEQLPAYVAQP